MWKKSAFLTGLVFVVILTESDRAVAPQFRFLPCGLGEDGYEFSRILATSFVR